MELIKTNIEECPEDYEVGDKFVAHAGAPGSGKKVWRIQEIRDGDAYGEVLENTIHVPGPSAYK